MEIGGEKFRLTDPTRLARMCAGAGSRLYFWRSTWISYRDGHYVIIPDAQIRQMVFERVLNDFRAYASEHDTFVRPITVGLKSNVLSTLQDLCHLNAALAPPCWISPDFGLRISLENGLFDPETGKLTPHNPDWFTFSTLPFVYDATAEPHQWLDFLLQTFGSNLQLTALLQQIFGYCLLPGNDFERFFYLVGPAASGKSTVLGVLRSLLGEDNCSAVSLEQFKQPFGAWPALNRLANISGEADCGGTNEALLKQWSGRDTVTVARKYLEPITCQPTAKLIFAGNDYPPFTDPSGGIKRRLLILPFERSVPPGMRDRSLRERIVRDELSGIFNWALAGRDELMAAGGFTEPEVTRRAGEEQRTFARPEEEFFREELAATLPKYYIESNVLYATYRGWASRSGIRDPLTRPWFFRQLCRFFPGAKRVQIINGERLYVYRGLTFINEGWAEHPEERPNATA